MGGVSLKVNTFVEQEKKENFMTLGTLLTKERERQGITLEDISQKTYIKIHYLKALENDRYDLLPAPVYTYGYIKQYAKILGLNGDELVQEYQRSQSEFNLRKENKIQNKSENKSMNSHTSSSDSFEDLEVSLPKIVKESNKNYNQLNYNQHIQNSVLLDELTSDSMSDTEGVRMAKSKAEQIIDYANIEAQKLKTEAEKYADEVLTHLEQDMIKMLRIIKNGREYLRNKQKQRKEEILKNIRKESD